MSHVTEVDQGKDDAFLATDEAEGSPAETIASETASANAPTDASPDSTSLSESFQAGDHVYVWCHLNTYQHHGVVIQLLEGENKVLIADFTNLGREPRQDAAAQGSLFASHESSHVASRSSSGLPGGFRYLLEDLAKCPWRKVKYLASGWERATWRPGTCSTAQPLDPCETVKRVHFLMQHFPLVPPYHVLWSNCETVAVWCTTGQWETLQGSHLIDVSKTTSVLGTGSLCWSAITAGAGAATATAEASMAAAAATANPFLWSLALAGLVAVGSAAAVWNGIQTRQRWEETGAMLNSAYEKYWMGPPAGVLCIPLEETESELCEGHVDSVH
jgi:hypothetical protein